MTDTAVSDDFARQVDPLRYELLAHCYRMLGSVQDAEDQVQETYLRAWRFYDRFEGRSSLRTWLYRIATRSCLTALESRGRRPSLPGIDTLDDDLGALRTTSTATTGPEYFPGVWPPAESDDPAGIVTSRESIRIAIGVAVRHLGPRQRTVLLLREVMKWRAAEVAELLGTTTTAVNSTLQRARARLAEAAPFEARGGEPSDPDERGLLDRFVAAVEDSDATAVMEIFRQSTQATPSPSQVEPEATTSLTALSCDPAGSRPYPVAV